ncbi:hypothetical protein A3Q34_18870 [Colwellia sp. PAMC 20917]|uniref:hypothetical protein n=1 Tax=Colwellia sp. PAMC 20917 TaxID=1816218 RepID=UPI0008782B82|nr:hypothetical protein [Colwellia sp. PAMC 20917]AOW78717.1 hypothetical protein A3Q34_18870 [Colwellia sp. PAMC 20917]
MNTKDFTTIFLIGIFSSIAFIVIQPLFGMLTLTSRHASAYINLGNYNETTAIVLSWIVHISVSVFYTFIASLIYNFNVSYLVSVAQVIILGWLTTLSATPANEWVVKLITTGQFTSITSLSELNTEIGPKLWLHILFFAFVLTGLGLSRLISSPKTSV